MTLLYAQNLEAYGVALHASRCNIIVTAAEPEALVQLCGISLLERLLRILQRLGGERVTIFSVAPQKIEQQLAVPSWPRADLALDIRPQKNRELSARDIQGFFEKADLRPNERTLIIDAGFHHDARLLEAMLRQEQTAVLVDSSPPATLLPLLEAKRRYCPAWMCGAAFVQKPWLSVQQENAPLFALLSDAAVAGEVATVDVNQQPTYVVDLRRDLRPLWFPAPHEKNTRLAERLLLDAAQNGTLDLPAKVHAPIETWIVARLCKTQITPNQITFFTAVISAAITVLFASGKLWPATVLALAVGVLDGLDGKQARVKVETTRLGKREHVLDYVLEFSWWAALAFYFASSGHFPTAGWWFSLLFSSDLLDRLAKAAVKRQTDRNLDDVSPFDRIVRLIGGRRNIYVWVMTAGLAIGAADQAFRFLCLWGAMTAAVHVGRAFSIRLRQRVAV